MNLVIIILMLINIVICTYKGYKRKDKYALYDLIMLFIFYALFIIFSYLIDKMDFSFTLINIKAKFNIASNIYDSLLTFIVSMIVRFIVFICMCLIYPLVKSLLYKWISKNINKKTICNCQFIGIIKGFVSSFLMLCIINSSISILPNLNKDNEISLYNYVLEKVDYNPKVKVALDIIDDYQNSKLIKLTNIKIKDKQIDDMFLSVLSFSSINDNESINNDIKDIFYCIDNLYITTNGFKDFNNIDVEIIVNHLKYNNLLDYFSTLIISTLLNLENIKSYLPFIDKSMYIDISLKEELNILSDIICLINNSFIDYNALTIKISSMKSINLIGYILSYNIFNNYFTNQEMIEIQDTLINLVKEKSYSKDVLIIDELYNYYLNIIKSKNILLNANSFVLKLLETGFVTKLLPSIINKAVTYLPNEYQDLIDINTIDSINIKEELNTILSILNILFINKGDLMAFDFSVLKKLSIEGVLKSDLLSHGFIKLIIDATDNKGLLKKYSKFIDIPSYLKTYDSKTKKYHSRWYGKDGELAIVLQIVKSSLVSINKKNDENQNIVNVINCLNTPISYNSEVLYYSFNKILKNIDVISINQEDLITIDNRQFINKDSLKRFIDTLCKFNVVNYYKVINNDYVHMFEYNNKKDLNSQIDMIINDNIVHASLSNAISNIKQLTLTDNTYNEIICLNNNEIKKIKLIDKKEIKNMIKLLFNMNIKLDELNDFNKLLTCLKQNKDSLLKMLDPMSSSYSHIIHFNISNVILNEIIKMEDIDTSKIINKYPNKLIDNVEIINMLNTLIILNNNNISFSNLTYEEVDKVSKLIITNKEILNSFIVKELLLEYIAKYS